MVTCEPTKEMLDEWKHIWLQYRDRLSPNRKSGMELVDYLQNNYVLTEISDRRAAEAVFYNVMRNPPFAEKLPFGAEPVPRTFYLENRGKGRRFYQPENKDPYDLWGGDVTRIFVGVDQTTGYYMVEGSAMLWDELCAFRGLDERDLNNYACVAQYINSLRRFGWLNPNNRPISAR
ncbi:MAG: hypothetical protein Q4F79_03450 [Eubacteriales bacterium]|nr:hypothetical protein [Eubacteriales bacterium]